MSEIAPTPTVAPRATPRNLIVEPLDPYAPPVSENLKPLGSLAQSARGKEISRARTTLIVIGILTMAVNGFLFYNLENEIQGAIRQGNMDPAQVEAFRQDATIAGYLLYLGPALLGLLFFVFGLIVQKYPVPITITSLVLYVGATLLFALLNPASLAQGIIIKIIIIVALFRAIKAALASNIETRKVGISGGELLA